MHLPVGGAYYIQRHLTEPSAVTSIVDITLNIIHLDKSEKECIGCKILWNLHPLEGPQASPHIPEFGDMTLQSYANIHTLQGTDRKFIKF